MRRWKEALRTRVPCLRSLLTAAVLAGGVDGVAEAANVEGNVKTPGGSPAVGVSVLLAKAGGFLPDSTTTDGSGHYKFEFVSANCYEIRAESPTYGLVLYGDTVIVEEQQRLTVLGPNLTGIDLQFLPPHALSGTITFGGASPPPNMLVTLLDASGNLTAIEKQFPQGSPGQYAYSFLVPSGDYLVRARTQFDTFYPGDAFTFRDGVKVTVADVDVDGRDFTAPPAPVLDVHLRDALDAPVPGLIETFDAGTGLNLTQSNTGLDGDATVSVPRPPGSDVIVTAHPSLGYPPFGNTDGTAAAWSIPVTLSGGTDEITIHKLDVPSLAGQVTEAGTGTPINGGTVVLTPAVPVALPGFIEPLTAQNFGGNYQFFSVHEGWYFVTASGPPILTDFHVPTRTPGLVHIDSATTGFNLQLSVGGRIQVTATRPGGSPVGTFRIDTFDSTCKLVDGVQAQRTGNLSPGGYRLRLTSPSDPSLSETWNGGTTCANAASVAVSASNTTPVAVEFHEVGTGKVGGIVSDVHGAAISFAFVTLKRISDGVPFVAVTNDCGTYALTVPNGSYSVSVGASGFDRVETAVTVSGGEVVKDFTLNPGSGDLVGNVKRQSDDAAVQGARVCARRSGDVVARVCADTDLEGFFRIPKAGPAPVVVETTYKSDFDARSDELVSLLQNAVISLELAADASESSDHTGGPKVAPNRPGRGTPGESRRPKSSFARAFQDAEDVDWFRFDAVSGKYYKSTLSGTLASITLINEALYVGATKAPVDGGAAALFGNGGWQAPSTGEFWVAMSSPFSGSYTVSLAESDTPPVQTPAVTSISPTSGPAAGGTSVTITGTDFVDGATVSFGGTPATNVVFVDSSHLTCTAPARPAGTLSDVVVTNPGPAAGTLTKGWFADFADVPQAYLYHGAVEKIVRAGITTGCGGGKYCPNDAVTRDAMAVFILRGEHGSAYNPPAATGTVFSDVTTGTFLAKWMEQFGVEGISTGCGGGSPPPYCPTASVTRDGMAVFLLRGKHGSTFNPPAATGTVFGDVSVSTFLAKWMEQLSAEGITSGCGGGNYCPGGTVTRGEMAKFIRLTFGL
jgi:hypothetical protein